MQAEIIAGQMLYLLLLKCTQQRESNCAIKTRLTLLSASDSSSELSDALLIDDFFLLRFFFTLFFSSCKHKSKCKNSVGANW